MTGRCGRGELLRTLGWLAAGGMGAVTATRLLPTTSEPLVIGLQGLTGWALLPAIPLAGLALWKRQPALASVAMALVVVQVGVTVAAVGRQQPEPLSEHQAPLRLVTANVLFDNAHLQELGDDIAADDADVVVLQEVTPEGLVRLQASALWRDYPHRSVVPRPLFHGHATFSRFPMSESAPVEVGGPTMLRTDIETPAGRVRVVNVHTMAPLTRKDARTWARQLERLTRVATESRVPVVLAGDFNATLAHAPMARLANGPVRDAFAEAGSGLGATWPSARAPVPPLMRLDHVLVSVGIGISDVAVRTSIGSDHRRLMVRLALPLRQGRPAEGVAPGAADGSNR